MAVSKITSAFPETLETDYTKFFTPSDDTTLNVVVNSMDLREISKDLFYIVMNVRATIPASSRAIIGNINLAYFNNLPITGVIPGVWQSPGDKYQSTQFSITSDGRVFMYNLSENLDMSNQYQTASGFLIRREV